MLENLNLIDLKLSRSNQELNRKDFLSDGVHLDILNFGHEIPRQTFQFKIPCTVCIQLDEIFGAGLNGLRLNGLPINRCWNKSSRTQLTRVEGTIPLSNL
jgi:hypothetical protein